MKSNAVGRPIPQDLGDGVRNQLPASQTTLHRGFGPEAVRRPPNGTGAEHHSLRRYTEEDVAEMLQVSPSQLRKNRNPRPIPGQIPFRFDRKSVPVYKSRSGTHMTENRNFETEPHVCEAYDNSKPVNLAVERHFSTQELAGLWNLSEKTIRRLFENEPGVISIGCAEERFRRAYITRRVPESHCSIPIMLPNFWKCIRRPCGKVNGAGNRNRQFGVGSIATLAGVPSSAPQEVLS